MTSWGTQSKNSASFSSQGKNATTFSNQVETSTSFTGQTKNSDPIRAIATATLVQYQTLPGLQSCESLFFKSDGSKLYCLNLDSNPDKIYQYSLSEPWNISTASLEKSQTFADDSISQEVRFKSDGSKLYVLGVVAQEINEYDLSIPWDISTRSLLQTVDITVNDSAPTGMSFSNNGTRMFISGDGDKTVLQYNLSTAWDISTAVYSQEKDVSAQTTGLDGNFISVDGTKFYLATYNVPSQIFQYSLSSANDISTASLVSTLTLDPVLDVGSYGLFVHPEGTRLWVTHNDNEGGIDFGIKEYSLGGWESQVSNTSSYNLQTKQ